MGCIPSSAKEESNGESNNQVGDNGSQVTAERNGAVHEGAAKNSGAEVEAENPTLDIVRTAGGGGGDNGEEEDDDSEAFGSLSPKDVPWYNEPERLDRVFLNFRRMLMSEVSERPYLVSTAVCSGVTDEGAIIEVNRGDSILGATIALRAINKNGENAIGRVHIELFGADGKVMLKFKRNYSSAIELGRGIAALLLKFGAKVAPARSVAATQSGVVKNSPFLAGIPPSEKETSPFDRAMSQERHIIDMFETELKVKGFSVSQVRSHEAKSDLGKGMSISLDLETTGSRTCWSMTVQKETGESRLHAVATKSSPFVDDEHFISNVQNILQRAEEFAKTFSKETEQIGPDTSGTTQNWTSHLASSAVKAAVRIDGVSDEELDGSSSSATSSSFESYTVSSSDEENE